MARLKSFRLQKVLEFKEHLEMMGTLELHRAQNEQKEAENKLNHLKFSKESLLQKADEHLKKQNKLALHDLRIQMSYLDQLHESIEHQNKAIQNLMEIVENKRNQLNKAVKDRKIIQTLKDQFTEKQKQEIKKMENGKIDEIAIRKTTNTQKAGA